MPSPSDPNFFNFFIFATGFVSGSLVTYFIMFIFAEKIYKIIKLENQINEKWPQDEADWWKYGKKEDE